MSDNRRVDRSDASPKEDLMDLVTFLAIAVAVVIALSGYFLFNEVPTIGMGSSSRRSSRR